MSKFWQKKYISKHTGAEIDEAVKAVLDGDVGTKVVANPTLAGTEAALTGLQVDETKYSVGGMTEAEADLRYLKLAGGTMTGTINASGVFWKDGTRTLAETMNGSTTIGSNQSAGDDLRLKTGNTANVYHQKGNAIKVILDEDNTAANPTLAGTEAALSSLKLNGTNYSIGSPLYQHSINAYASYGTSSQIIFSTIIVNNSSTAFTSATFRNYCTAYPLSCSGMVVDDNSKVSSIIKVNYISSTSTWLFGGGMTIAPTAGTLDITTNYSVPSGTTFTFYDTVKQI